MAIVKANAYGHGAVEVAGAIKDKVYGFAVATVREALTLRESGVDNPILVLGYVCKAEYESVIRNNIICHAYKGYGKRYIRMCRKDRNYSEVPY